MADKPFRPLFDDCGSVNWSDSHFDCFFEKRGSEPRGDTAARKGKGIDNLTPLLELKCVFDYSFPQLKVLEK